MFAGGDNIYNISGARENMPFMDVAPGIASFCRKSGGFDVAALNLKPHETEEMYPKWYIPIHLDPVSEINYWNNDSYSTQIMKFGMFNICPQGVIEKVIARNDHKVLLVTFEQILIDEIIEHNPCISLLKQKANYGLYDNSIVYLAMALRSDLDAKSPYGQLYSKSLAFALINRIFDIANASGEIKIEQNCLSINRLKRVTEYIKANLNKRLSLDEIADVACLTPFHFSRQFKSATNLSPHQFVLKLKIEHAKELLKKTELSIANISLELGFQNQSHFTTVFHKIVGITPREFSKL